MGIDKKQRWKREASNNIKGDGGSYPNKKNAKINTNKRDESGIVIKKQKGLLNFGLVYPNTYQIGMSNLGFQCVYSLLNANDNVSCHRYFFDNKYDKVSFNSISRNLDKTNELKSCETSFPLSSCNVVAFSVSFENDYLNVVSIIRNTGIPLRALDRNSSHPLIIAGGVACFLNPEPLAPFIDCFLLGEAEEMLPSFLETFIPLESKIRHLNIINSVTSSDQTISHEQIKRELALSVKGVYVPQFYQPSYSEDGNFLNITALYDDIPKRIPVQHINDLTTITTTSQILTKDTAFDNTYLIETGRGCHHGCRFCSAGFIYRPPRFYSDECIIGAINQFRRITYKTALEENKTEIVPLKIGLVGANVSDHPSINHICNSVRDVNNFDSKIKISFSSLRLDALTDETIQTLVKSSVRTATIAPEAGSHRMRNIINKKINEEQILSTVQRLIEHGIINLKLYFMIGLPFEEDDDVNQIVLLTEKIKTIFLDASRKNRKIGKITLSINPFIPKPNTPFQWCAMDTMSNFKKKVNIIKDGLKRLANIIINIESPKTSLINAVLSRGDRRIADILETPELFFRKIKDLEIEKTVCRAIDLDAPLPWDIIDTGIKKSFLIKEFRRAQLEKTSPDCPMVSCSSCGLCR